MPTRTDAFKTYREGAYTKKGKEYVDGGAVKVEFKAGIRKSPSATQPRAGEAHKDLFGKPGSLLFGTPTSVKQHRKDDNTAPYRPHRENDDDLDDVAFGTGGRGGKGAVGRAKGGLEKSVFSMSAFDASTTSAWTPPSARSAKAFSFDTPSPKAKLEDVSGLGYFAFPPPSTPSDSPSSTTRTTTSSSATTLPSTSTSKTTLNLPATPTPSTSKSTLSISTTKPTSPSNNDTDNTSANAEDATDPDPWSTHLATLHTTRLTAQASASLPSEEAWVAAGGVLRDPATGQRDLGRTRAVRAELELRAREARLRSRWEAYEARWREVVKTVRGGGRKGGDSKVDGEGQGQDGMQMDAGGREEEEEGLRFLDLPWPVEVPPPSPPTPTTPTLSPSIPVSPPPRGNKPRISFCVRPAPRPSPPPTRTNHTPTPAEILAQLTPKDIETFLLEPLTVRGCAITRRERIRSSLLRWHPDKMGAVVEAVREGEREEVREGIGRVVRALQVLKDKEWRGVL